MKGACKLWWKENYLNNFLKPKAGKLTNYQLSPEKNISMGIPV